MVGFCHRRIPTLFITDKFPPWWVFVMVGICWVTMIIMNIILSIMIIIQDDDHDAEDDDQDDHDHDAEDDDHYQVCLQHHDHHHAQSLGF